MFDLKWFVILRQEDFFLVFCFCVQTFSCNNLSIVDKLIMSQKSSKTSTYRDKVQQLQGELHKAQDVLGSEKCLPTMAIAAAAAPLLLFLIIFFLSPSFVQRKEGSKYIRCLKKVFMWTIILTLMVWAGMYLFTYCQGWEGTSICTRM